MGCNSTPMREIILWKPSGLACTCAGKGELRIGLVEVLRWQMRHQPRGWSSGRPFLLAIALVAETSPLKQRKVEPRTLNAKAYSSRSAIRGSIFVARRISFGIQ